MRLFLVSILIIAVLLQCNALAQDAQKHFRKGHRFYLDSKSTESEAEFKAALELDPTLSDAHYYLSSIYFKQERYGDAVAHCEQALEINPEDLKSLIILGLSLQQLDFIEQAIEMFQKACQLNNQSAAAHSALGLAYCAKGEFAKAKEEYRALKEIDPELARDLLQVIKEAQF